MDKLLHLEESCVLEGIPVVLCKDEGRHYIGDCCVHVMRGFLRVHMRCCVHRQYLEAKD